MFYRQIFVVHKIVYYVRLHVNSKYFKFILANASSTQQSHIVNVSTLAVVVVVVIFSIFCSFHINILSYSQVERAHLGCTHNSHVQCTALTYWSENSWWKFQFIHSVSKCYVCFCWFCFMWYLTGDLTASSWIFESNTKRCFVCVAQTKPRKTKKQTNVHT